MSGLENYFFIIYLMLQIKTITPELNANIATVDGSIEKI